MADISRDELKRLIEKKAQYILIDVREPEEVASYGKLPTAHNVPLSEFEEAFALDQEAFQHRYGFAVSQVDRVIVYCRSGGRSAQAAAYLHELGYQVENYAGSALEWSEIDENVKAY